MMAMKAKTCSATMGINTSEHLDVDTTMTQHTSDYFDELINLIPRI